jgi:hypothetical protein
VEAVFCEGLDVLGFPPTWANEKIEFVSVRKRMVDNQEKGKAHGSFSTECRYAEVGW